MSRVLVTLPDSLMQQIDVVAGRLHKRRSEFFRDLAVQYLAQHATAIPEVRNLEAAAAANIDFWLNEDDDAIWNAPPTT